MNHAIRVRSIRQDPSERGKNEEDAKVFQDGKRSIDINAIMPTQMKVHRKHLSPQTLDLYDLPWEWDEVSYTNLERVTKAADDVQKDVNYIIKRWIPEHDQNILFEHTRTLRMARLEYKADVTVRHAARLGRKWCVAH